MRATEKEVSDYIIKLAKKLAKEGRYGVRRTGNGQSSGVAGENRMVATYPDPY